MATPKRRTAYKVSVNLPDDVTRESFAEYVRHAVENWRYGEDSDSAIFNADLKIKVTRLQTKKKPK